MIISAGEIFTKIIVKNEKLFLHHDATIRYKDKTIVHGNKTIYTMIKQLHFYL